MARADTKQKETGVLYVVATPIGNLKDITLRAIDILKSVTAIYAEDTRVTLKLLAHYDIHTPLRSFHAHSKQEVIEEVVDRLSRGEALALTTDAGTPGISDPGGALVAKVRETLPKLSIIPIPGVSALTTILSISGVEFQSCAFLSYPPHKKGRQKFFLNVKNLPIRPVVLYESKHRIIKTLDALQESLGSNIKVIVGNDLTKLHEQVYSGNIVEVSERVKRSKILGEFVILIE